MIQYPTLDKLPRSDVKKGWPWTEESDIPAEMGEGFSWPRITLITTSYNKGRYIEEAIRSVLLQGYPNLEYFVIDGGSSDDSLDVIKTYNRWLTYWVSEPDRGQAHAINKGIEMASGDIISWVHADDMLFPGACYEMAKRFSEHPHVALIYGAGAKIDENSQIVKDVLCQEYDPVLLRTRCYLFQPSVFIKQISLKEIGLLDETLNYWMDWDLYLRLCKNFPAYSTEKRIGMWRAHKETKTRKDAYSVKRREVAFVGRKNNGILDRNNTTFWILHAFYIAENVTSLRIFRWIRAKIAGLLDRLYGEDTYYNAAMFESNMGDL